MDPYAAGWLSLLPPIIAISLALWTKEVFSSLLIGIFSGTLVYSCGMDLNPVMGTISTAFAIIVKKVDFEILMFCSLLGSLVFVIAMSGGSHAYGVWASRRINSRRQSLLTTGGLGALIFIDDYFNCLTVGTVMKPVTDGYKVSRAKLAYIIDSMAAPICIIAPVSSWAAAVGSNLKATGAFDSEMAAFVATIPWNFYALLSLLMVIALCYLNCDFGPMKDAELRAADGDLGAVEVEHKQNAPEAASGTMWDMLIPLVALVVFAVLAMLYTGGYWGKDPAFHTFPAAFGECASSTSLVWASFGALLVAFLMYVPRRLMTLAAFSAGVVEGVKIMLPACMILVLAWGISGVCRDLLSTPQFVKGLVAGGGFASALLPMCVFLIAGFLSFSTGTAWGTFGILIPIIVPVAQALDPQLVIVSLSATLAGSVFGDHCSPISDTTILASAGASCNHLEHVSTQLPYACTVAGCCAVGYLVAGLTGGSLVASLAAGAVALIVAILILYKRNAGKTASA